MNNPLEILRALDKNLDHKVSLVLFGKAAIALGFQHPPEGSDQTIGFLIEADNITPEELEAAFKTARVPDENEILDLFQRAQPLVLEIAEKLVGGKGVDCRPRRPFSP
jgi:hypothetical protein